LSGSLIISDQFYLGTGSLVWDLGQTAGATINVYRSKTSTYPVFSLIASPTGFDFYNDNLSEIMKQLSRWYDVEIIYSSPINEQHFTGSIRREVNISQVLQMLKLAGGVDFIIDGNKIIVKSQ
jgi:type II secretory pathway component GspD/PulD (secretin)